MGYSFFGAVFTVRDRRRERQDLLYSCSKGGGKIRIGYARVSTTEQNRDSQRDALKRAGYEKIIEDMASGGKRERPGLERVQETLRHGDALAVWRLDRLGRSLKHLIELMAELEGQGGRIVNAIRPARS
jgi:DNA invertase Pin-like site-specific DNA recombinase